MNRDSSPSPAPHDPLAESAIFPTIGEAGFTRLVAAFYARVRSDSILGPMYPAEDWEGSERRLRDFLLFRFGGSDRYIQERGHPRLRMRHAPFAVTLAARNRWIELMEAALAEAELPLTVSASLRQFFHATATFMINQDAH